MLVRNALTRVYLGGGGREGVRCMLGAWGEEGEGAAGGGRGGHPGGGRGGRPGGGAPVKHVGVRVDHRLHGPVCRDELIEGGDLRGSVEPQDRPERMRQGAGVVLNEARLPPAPGAAKGGGEAGPVG